MISWVMYNHQCRVGNKYNGVLESGRLGAGRGLKWETIDGIRNLKLSVVEMRHPKFRKC